MKAGSRLLIGLGTALLFAGGAAAQMGMGMGMRRPQGIWNPVIGAGAAYAIDHRDGSKTQMEVIVVGKEVVDGKEGYWFEMTMPNRRGEGDMIMKMLYVLDGENMVTRRVIMQQPGMDPMEMPMQMMQRRRPQEQAADFRKNAEDLGSESVTTPAGTFTCEHFRKTGENGTSDSWISKDVSPYGLIKSTGPDSSMTLTKVITNAKEKITGTPKPFDPMMMQRRPD
jgi:Domain of unknown function (DUF4412)